MAISNIYRNMVSQCQYCGEHQHLAKDRSASICSRLRTPATHRIAVPVLAADGEHQPMVSFFDFCSFL